MGRVNPVVIEEQQAGPVTAAPARTSLLHAIVNPAAGNGSAGRRWPAIAETIARHGYDLESAFTTGPGHAIELARRFADDGARTIVCVGGDGTVNEVVNGLVDDDRSVNPDTCLAIVPCGTGKDLGRTLETRDIEATLRAIVSGGVARVDVGRVRWMDERTDQSTTRCLVNVADAGIGAATAARINQSSKRLGGLISYLTGAVRSIAAFEPWDAVVEVDGEVIHDGETGMVVFANGRYFAGGMKVAPYASLCDGLLDVFVLQGVGKRALLTSLLPRVYRGKHVGQPGVTWRQGRTATVRSCAGMPLELDGEHVGRTPLTIDLLPRVLLVAGDPDALERMDGCADNVQ
jgi:YegS/Rv2252/BmrU family lipid kinase